MTHRDGSAASDTWLPWKCPKCDAEHSDPDYITETFCHCGAVVRLGGSQSRLRKAQVVASDSNGDAASRARRAVAAYAEARVEFDRQTPGSGMTVRDRSDAKQEIAVNRMRLARQMYRNATGRDIYKYVLPSGWCYAVTPLARVMQALGHETKYIAGARRG
jgi:hypothetical protein